MHHRGDRSEAPKQEFDPRAEVRCVHVEACGACPLMFKRYEEQRATKMARIERALGRYRIEASGETMPLRGADPIMHYRRRAKLVVERAADGKVRVGLYRRNDNHNVVDIPECQVLSPPLMELVRELRTLVEEPPAALRVLLEAVRGEDEGVLKGLDARELSGPSSDKAEVATRGILLTLLLTAERAAEVDVLREAARELRRLLPQITGLAVDLRYKTRQQGGNGFVLLSGVNEAKDALLGGYQLVSHTSFLNVHRPQAEQLYQWLVELVGTVGDGLRVLDLYGGTGAISLTLAAAGHRTTMVESYPPAAALAERAAQAQRASVEVVTGDAASVSKALASAGSTFDVVIANPPRRGLSPAARESITALGAQKIVYVACDLNNLSRDLDHMARLGYQMTTLTPLDMLPLTEEVEAVAVLERTEAPVPTVLYQDDQILALNKPPHEPVQNQAEYPGSLVQRAAAAQGWGDWVTVLRVEASTSGLCLFARDEATASRWIEALKDHGRLVYLAAARGVTPAKGAITRELRGEAGSVQARTRYRRLAVGGGHSILRVVPEKRYTHQIRRHLAAIGHPVLGDARYGHGPTNRYFEEKHGLDRSFLHLVRMELSHPDTGERLVIEAPMPPDLRTALVRVSDESVLGFLENKNALGGGVPTLGDRPSGSPMIERSPLSTAERGPESAYPTQIPGTVRGGGEAIELDEAPRTVRGELLTPDED